jgi:hypothetical protein
MRNSDYEQYGHRPDYLAATRVGMTHAADEAGFLFFYSAQAIGVGGCLSQTNDVWTRDTMPIFHTSFLKFLSCEARGAATLPNKHVRLRCKMLVCTATIYHSILYHQVSESAFLMVYRQPSLPVRYTLYTYDVSYREGCQCVSTYPGF